MTNQKIKVPPDAQPDQDGVGEQTTGLPLGKLYV